MSIGAKGYAFLRRYIVGPRTCRRNKLAVLSFRCGREESVRTGKRLLHWEVEGKSGLFPRAFSDTKSVSSFSCVICLLVFFGAQHDALEE